MLFFIAPKKGFWPIEIHGIIDNAYQRKFGMLLTKNYDVKLC